MVVAYRNGAPVRLEELGDDHRRRRRRQTASWFYTHDGEQRAITSASSASPAPTPSPSPTRSRTLLPQFQRRAAAQRPHGRPLRPLGHDPRVVPRRAVHHAADARRWSIMVIFVFLRNVSATVIPSLALPFSIIGTFAVMYMLGLQPRQPVDDGADPLGRLRRGRRDRDAGEHLPARRDGRGSADRVARRIARNRLHHRLDDAVAGRGVHPGAVHGRRARPAVPRVRGHHLRRDSDLRRRVGHADADAVQPLPEEAVTSTARQPVRRGHRAGASTACCAATTATLQVVLRHRGATMAAFVAVLVADRRAVRRWCRRASSPIRTPIRSR